MKSFTKILIPVKEREKVGDRGSDFLVPVKEDLVFGVKVVIANKDVGLGIDFDKGF